MLVLCFAGLSVRLCVELHCLCMLHVFFVCLRECFFAGLLEGVRLFVGWYMCMSVGLLVCLLFVCSFARLLFLLFV